VQEETDAEIINKAHLTIAHSVSQYTHSAKHIYMAQYLWYSVTRFKLKITKKFSKNTQLYEQTHPCIETPKKDYMKQKTYTYSNSKKNH